MITTYKAAPDIDVLTSSFPIPGFGLVPINAFVLHGPEPVLVDTGAVVEREEFMTALRSVIDPADLKWIWLTHTDFDHIGALPQLLDENVDLRIITTFLGVGIMSLNAPLPMDRVHLLNPGERIVVGDRTLTAVKPPAFDNPSTTGFHDDKSGALFSSDCFGALLSAVPDNAAELTDDELRQGQVFWATVDSPWLHKVDTAAFARELDGIRADRADDDPEQPSTRRLRQHDGPTAGVPRGRPVSAALRRTRSSGTGTNADRDDGWSNPVVPGRRARTVGPRQPEQTTASRARRRRSTRRNPARRGRTFRHTRRCRYGRPRQAPAPMSLYCSSVRATARANGCLLTPEPTARRSHACAPTADSGELLPLLGRTQIASSAL